MNEQEFDTRLCTRHSERSEVHSCSTALVWVVLRGWVHLPLQPVAFCPLPLCYPWFQSGVLWSCCFMFAKLCLHILPTGGRNNGGVCPFVRTHGEAHRRACWPIVDPILTSTSIEHVGWDKYLLPPHPALADAPMPIRRPIPQTPLNKTVAWSRRKMLPSCSGGFL